MLGIEPHQFISFLRQLGLAVAGASSLWGMVFMYLSSRKAPSDPGAVIFAWIGLRLRFIVFAGAILAIFAWLALLAILPTEAHEGITLLVSKNEMLYAAEALWPVYMFLALVFFLGATNKNFESRTTMRGINFFYLSTFIASFIAISHYTNLVRLPGQEAIFHAFHGFHSIFTLGTVLTLDFLFLTSRGSDILQQHIFPLFPKISKVIWIGLSLDLFSVLLIFPEAVNLSPRFFFAQTVVGILIINGVLLSGILTRHILKLLAAGRKETSKKWLLFASISGTISVVSWTSITFVDFFPGLGLSYPALMALYVLIILVLFSIHEVWERKQSISLPI